MFSTLDHEDSGIITFEVNFNYLLYIIIAPLCDCMTGRKHMSWALKLQVAKKKSFVFFYQDFVIGLSILLRGSVEEKARWMFLLYDQDRDGFISRLLLCLFLFIKKV